VARRGATVGAQGLRLEHQLRALLDGKDDEMLGGRTGDRHALLDARTAPFAEHDELGLEGREPAAVRMNPGGKALVVGLGR